ncbi:hypothetical protein NPS70_16505 [Streptomyces sp. C10-9-1]|uniref:hypothetical protein n=1 Tax=Streptomyces sp. C10-9-1 TaxID=1859285 RepID=UPI002111F446|nr:hypothetical protein [Streptomyces sp. C10-9-1]MCQ6554788.1 hypothetical protein [Streptomyces sp. C10-9-1]
MTRVRMADAIQRAAERAVMRLASSWGLATVSTVHTDGTCTVDTPLGSTSRVRRLRSYDNPQVGDVVKVSRDPRGNWLIVGAQATANPAWQSLTLSAGWSGHASYYTPAVRLHGDGTASLSGLASNSGTVTSGATVATLPAGTWPTKQVRVAVQVAVGYFGVMTILPNGTIQLGDFSGTLPGGNKFAEFDAMTRYRLN